MFKNPPISSTPTTAAPKPIRVRSDGARPTHGLATRHETLFLRLTALHKDVTILATRRGHWDLPETVRVLVEGLLAETAPYRDRRDRLPVAAPDLAGLCVQLGQALAQMEDYQHRHTFWDAGENCWSWQLDSATLPVRRLQPQSPQKPELARGDQGIREKFTRMILINRNMAYERGFEAGRAARMGPPAPQGHAEPDAIGQNNPRLADLG